MTWDPVFCTNFCTFRFVCGGEVYSNFFFFLVFYLIFFVLSLFFFFFSSAIQFRVFVNNLDWPSSKGVVRRFVFYNSLQGKINYSTRMISFLRTSLCHKAALIVVVFYVTLWTYRIRFFGYLRGTLSTFEYESSYQKLHVENAFPYPNEIQFRENSTVQESNDVFFIIILLSNPNMDFATDNSRTMPHPQPPLTFFSTEFRTMLP